MTGVEAAMLALELVEGAVAVAKEIAAAEAADAAKLGDQLRASLAALRGDRAQVHAAADARQAKVEQDLADAEGKGGVDQ